MNLITRSFSVRLLLLAGIATIGCDTSPTTGPMSALDHRNLEPATHTDHRASDPALPVVSGTELEALVRQSTRPVLVEFGVDVACPRCEQMRPQIVQLARQFEGKATVVRVDFNANRQSAMRYGATICPSYVIFDQSQVMQSRNFPTSADLLAVDLESVVEKEDAGH